MKLTKELLLQAVTAAFEFNAGNDQADAGFLNALKSRTSHV